MLRLPTDITGTSNRVDVSHPILYRKFLASVIKAYIAANGKNMNRNFAKSKISILRKYRFKIKN
jgi:hypothetical protein